MAITEPQTYGEWYGRMMFESYIAEQEKYEEELDPVTISIVSGLNILDFLPPSLAPLFSALTKPTSAAWGSIMGRFVSECADGVVGQTLNHALKDFNYQMAEWFGDLRIDAPTASLLWQRGKIIEEMFDARMKSQGFKPEEAAAFYEASMPYPSVPEIMVWARYHGDPDNIRAKTWERFRVSEIDFDLWEWLTLQRLTTEQAQSLYKRGLLDDATFATELARLGWSKEDRPRLRDLAYTLPNAMLLVQGGVFNQESSDVLRDYIRKADIHPDFSELYLDAVLTKPASSDIINYQLRRDPSLSGLAQELTRIGIHPDYTDLYRELAYQIPPVADIITMAVREAFSPSVAERFGQYQDYPTDFGKYAAMKGLSEEWAKRYWAAHWSLPSPQQGFEMLHRGVITDGELDLLLRALDVMPFWRDKLKAIAYRPLTRVDVRRMYAQGVLTEKQVFDSYLQQGYDEENAENMTEFTVRQTLSSLAKFTSGDIVKAYTQRMIDSSEARSLLESIGIKGEDASYIIKTAETKRLWDFTDEKIKGIKNLYKKKVYDENQTRAELNKLDLPAEEVRVLMEQWWFEAEADVGPTWTTAQTLSFVKKGLITKERARQELQIIGYDVEHIDVYMKSV